MFYGCSNLTNIPSFNTSKVTSMSYMFYLCNNLTNVPNFDTSKVTSMGYMFYGCNNLTNVPNFNTSNVINMSRMFYSCKDLTNVPNFDTSKVTTMTNMLSYCYNLINVPNFNTSNITNMSGMFFSCYNLTNIPNFNTSNVTNMDHIFYFCSNLTDIPNFDTSNVTDISFMFSYCSNLTNIPSFNTSKVTNMSGTFSYCNNLTNVSLINIARSLPNVAQLTSQNSNLQNIGLSQKQINYISTTKYASQLQARGWNIVSNYGHEPRIKKIKSKITNNLFSTYYIGMDAKYINITPDTLNFLTENITVDELYGSMINYLNKQINIKYRAFDISYDLGDINSLVEDRVYYDNSENGENLRNYIETIPNNCCNLSIIEIAAPYFNNAARLFELPQT